jgi:hypothetical protein
MTFQAMLKDCSSAVSNPGKLKIVLLEQTSVAPDVHALSVRPSLEQSRPNHEVMRRLVQTANA